jgi:hypothetical protein
MPFIYTKNEDGLFVCPDCGVTKTNQNTMHYHMKKHLLNKDLEESNYVCQSCKKGFLQKQALELHVRSKHPEKDKPVQKFACTHANCSFTSLTKSNAIIHFIRIHYSREVGDIMVSGVQHTKNISCTQCDKEFKSSCSFLYHSPQCIPFDKTTETYVAFTKL